MKNGNLNFFYGEDDFSLKQEVSRWRDAFVEKFGDTNLIEFTGEDLSAGKANLAELKSMISSMPFLSEKRLLILKNCLKVPELVEAVREIPEHSIVLIEEGGEPDKRTSAFKFLSTNANVKLFLKPKGAQLNGWISRRSRISSDAAAYLASVVGDNLWALENELQKLSLYAGEKEITIDMIDELVCGNVQASIFELTDKLSAKDNRGALKAIQKLEDRGEEAGFIFAMIVRQFRLMLEVKSLLEMRMTPAMIASRMKVHPFVITNVSRQCKNFTFKQLRNILEKFLEIDRKLKTGGIQTSTKNSDHYFLAIEKVLISQ